MPYPTEQLHLCLRETNTIELHKVFGTRVLITRFEIKGKIMVQVSQNKYLYAVRITLSPLSGVVPTGLYHDGVDLVANGLIFLFTGSLRVDVRSKILLVYNMTNQEISIHLPLTFWFNPDISTYISY